MKAVKSKGNVFADIGFAPGEAEMLAVKADLLTLVARTIRNRRLTQAEAADICATEQATLSKALNGKLASLTLDRLARWAFALGSNIKLSVQPPSRARKRAKHDVHDGV